MPDTCDYADDVEALLPWYAVGALSAADSRRVIRALALRPELAAQYAEIRVERAAIARLNEECSLSSERMLDKLMSAISAESPRREVPPSGLRPKAALLWFYPHRVAVKSNFPEETSAVLALHASDPS